MKPIIKIFSIVCLLAACSSPKNEVAKVPPQKINCPETTSAQVKIESEEDFYQINQIQKIVTETDIIKFQSLKYDFVFCRENKSFTVQPGTLETGSNQPENYEEGMAKLADPPYESIELNGKIYQYRVILDPNPFPDFKQQANQVIFEFILPESEQPQQQVLYTFEQVKKAKTGIQLGVPKITAAITYDNGLFWSVSPEQGEGNGGIATIVNYKPESNEITVIQPAGMEGQQINDLIIVGQPTNPTFWIATQKSGEGNPFLPGMGLVAYNPNSKTLTSYNMRNSSLIGAIPNSLKLEGEDLWVGTGNGICQIKIVAEPQSWNCWRFVLMAKLPSEGVPIYPTLLTTESENTLTGETVEVLWWSPQNYETRQGRYEVKYEPGFTVKLDDQGGISWAEYYQSSSEVIIIGEAPIYWSGKDWKWSGNRFTRGFDQVSLNYFGGGPIGIGSWEIKDNNPPDKNAIRGDLELLELTKNSTEVKYYSGWVDDSLLLPYLTIIPQEQSDSIKPNPLEGIKLH